MTQTPGEPVTRPTPTSVAAPAHFEDVHPVGGRPGRTLPAALGSRRSLTGLAALAVGAVLAALVVRRRASSPCWRDRLRLG